MNHTVIKETALAQGLVLAAQNATIENEPNPFVLGEQVGEVTLLKAAQLVGE